MNSTLIAFLYLLMRDELVPGKVARLIKKSETTKGKTVWYSNKHLANYAVELARRLSK